MKRLRRIAQFARAAFRGARLYRRLGYPLLPVAWGALASISAPVGQRAPFTTRLHRMRACRRCIVYDPVHKTCGDGFVYRVVDGSSGKATEQIEGCQCWLPLKIGVPKARCWLVDIGVQGLWKK